MPRRRNRKRNYKMINFKVYFDTDADILDWWESIEAGERSDALRDAIRDFIGLRKKPRPRKIIELPELHEVRRDTVWIRDVLNDMPAYFEDLLAHTLGNLNTITLTDVAQANSVMADTHDPALNQDETQRRTKRLKKATW